MNPFLLGMGNLQLPKSAQQLNPLLLAYLGDSVYEVYVRYHLLARGFVKPHELQKEAVQYVSAVAQANVCRQLESHLTEEELDVLRRGRNAKSGSVAKSASVIQYRYSTGFEALVGYLYVIGNQARLDDLMQIVLRMIDEEREETTGGN